MAEQESLQFSFSASTKVWLAIVGIVSSLGGTGYAVMSWFTTRADVQTQGTKLDQQIERERAAWDAEKADYIEQLCLQRRQLRLLAAAVVRTKAAEAEPVRARRAETAKGAFDSFIDSTTVWENCKDSVHVLNEKLRDRPLNAAWARTLGTPPPGSE